MCAIAMAQTGTDRPMLSQGILAGLELWLSLRASSRASFSWEDILPLVNIPWAFVWPWLTLDEHQGHHGWPGTRQGTRLVPGPRRHRTQTPSPGAHTGRWSLAWLSPSQMRSLLLWRLWTFIKIKKRIIQEVSSWFWITLLTCFSLAAYSTWPA